MLWKAHVPHNGETYLADWKDDGYRKKRLGKKNTVRICDETEWCEKKKKWIEDYKSSTPVSGLKVRLTYKDSWLYESHYKINFEDELKESDFQQSVNNYLAFLINEKGDIQ